MIVIWFPRMKMLINNYKNIFSQLGLLLADSLSSNNIAANFVTTSKNLSQTAEKLFVSSLYVFVIVMYVVNKYYGSASNYALFPSHLGKWKPHHISQYKSNHCPILFVQGEKESWCIVIWYGR